MRIERFISGEAADRVTDILLLVGLDGSIVDANHAALECYGYSRPEILSLSIRDIRAPETLADIGDQMRHAVEEGVRFETRHRRSDGSVFAVEVRSERVQHGDETALLSVIRDISDRVSAEKALHESEERFRTMFEQSIVAMSMTRPSGEAEMNPAFADMLGYSPEELADATWQQLTHPDDIEETQRFIDDLVAGTKSSARFEKRYLSKDGRTVWTDLSTSLRRDSTGAPIYFITTVLDVTERKIAEEELRRQLQTSRALLNAITESAFIVGLAGEILAINDTAARRIGGLAPSELIGVVSWDLFDADLAAERRRVFDQVVATGEPAQFEDIRDGRHILNSYYPVVVDDRVIQVATFGYDMTEIYQGTQSLRESEEKFRTLAALAPVGIYLTDPEGNCRYANPAWCRMAGLTPEEALGQGWVSGLHPDDSGMVFENWERMVESQGNWGMEYRFQTPEGATTLVYGLAAPQCDASGNVVSYVGVNLDITERKAAEEKLVALMDDLERSNSDLEQFAYIASHDLREPLRMVTSYTEMLQRRYRGQLDSDADDFIEFAVDGANRMQRMLEDLLEFSRVGTRGKPPQPMSSRKAFDEALANLSDTISATGALITADELPMVMADDTQLMRVFQNLIGNSIKFCRPDAVPRVHVSATRDGEQWRFCLADNGIGLPAKGFEEVFEVFRRMAPRDQYPGTGIGLSVCRRIVERLGGSIWVECSGDSGTTFCFTLPAAP